MSTPLIYKRKFHFPLSWIPTGISYGALLWKTNLKPDFSFLSTVGVLLSEKITDAIYGKYSKQMLFKISILYISKKSLYLLQHLNKLNMS